MPNPLLLATVAWLVATPPSQPDAAWPSKAHPKWVQSLYLYDNPAAFAQPPKPLLASWQMNMRRMRDVLPFHFGEPLRSIKSSIKDECSKLNNQLTITSGFVIAL